MSMEDGRNVTTQLDAFQAQQAAALPVSAPDHLESSPYRIVNH